MQKINNNNFLIKNKTHFIKKYSKERKESFEREFYFYNFFKNNQKIFIPKLINKKKNRSITFQYYPFKKIKSQSWPMPQKLSNNLKLLYNLKKHYYIRRTS